MDKLTGQYFRTKIKEINEKLEGKRINEELLQEIATVGRKDACKELKNGMRLEVITSEYKNTGEEPHLHLFQQNLWALACKYQWCQHLPKFLI